MIWNDLLATALVAALTLGGCAAPMSPRTEAVAPPVSSEVPLPTPTPTPEPTPTPTPAPTPTPVPATVAYTEQDVLRVLMFHNFVPDGEEGDTWSLTERQLRSTLQWIQDYGYQTVLPRELVRGEPLPRRAVLLTVDDGYASNYHLLLPLLREYNAKAVIALVTSYIESGQENYLTWEMCREMAASGLVEFGSHTDSLHEEDNCIARQEGESREDYQARVFPDLEKSIRILENQLGQSVVYFAYPHGKTDSWSNEFIDGHFPVSTVTKFGRTNTLDKGLARLKRMNVDAQQAVRWLLPKN